MELVDAHQDVLPIEDSVYANRELIDMGVEEKINALYELWDAGTNKDNAERDAYSGSLDKDMHGRIMSIYQTYDYLDNEKYKRIEQLLDIMQETFGFVKDDDGDEELDTAGNDDGVEMADLPARSTAGGANVVAPGTRSDFGGYNDHGGTRRSSNKMNRQ
jgi:hypothetical protein